MSRIALLLRALSLSLASPSKATALEFQYVPPCNCGVAFDDAALILDGSVERGDAAKLARALDRHPDVTEIIVGISPGGSLAAGIGIAKLIRSRGLYVKLEGPAASAAAVLSLGARDRVRFQGDSTQQQGSTLLFHCAYLRGETTCHRDATQLLASELSTLSVWSTETWFRLLMTTSPSTVQRVSLWDILGKSNWTSKAEAHLSVVCHRN